jgi:hypothetical protein
MMVGKNPGSSAVARRIKRGSYGVEIGVWRGDSSELFLDKMGPEGVLHLVDSWSVTPYEGTDEHGGFEDYLSRYEKLVGSRDPESFQSYYDKIHNSVKERFAGRGVVIHRMTSEKFFSNPPRTIFNWAYIDASHAYEEVMKDLTSASLLVEAGGVIWGDDYSPKKPGVLQAVDDFANELGLPLENFGGDQYQIKLPR